jgi:eukaryotic-like serine/threonine-protein kinase
MRELRGGGMSRVFVAREKALGRTVVLKVLSPDLSAGISVERFRREIQLAAGLQHPNILPLLSAGRAGNFLYYTMPFVEGESLRDRLSKGGELPVRSAVRILGGVARALACAHRQGIVHRDIKPDNILLTGDDAQVADFGIAKAISASADRSALTSVGVALGTPLYMAPEQAAADPTTDARADLYSLGVVAYEILAGQPPFQGRTAAHLLAAHAAERPVPVRERRRAVPVALGDTIMQLLEKRPADRPQSADELLSVLDVSQAASDPSPTTRVSPYASSARAVSHRGRWFAAAGAAGLLLVLVIAWLTRGESPLHVDSAVVAVAPFRVSGADSSLSYLREGMVDLLAAKLSGTAGLRAADPRGVLAAWRRKARGPGDLPEQDAVRVSQALGAGRLIEGDVVGTRQQITINAASLDTRDHRVTAQASVEGSPDSLARLVDRLAGQLLALEAGESEQRLASLTSTSLPALRAYLDGQALIRTGGFRRAAEKFGLALQLDSSFALAGLGLSRAAGWFGEPSDGPGGILAWKYRSKLSPVDRALLDVYLGPRWPALSRVRDVIAACERLAQVAPDNAEAWQVLADNLYHNGGLVGLPDALPRAAQAFARAIALDSSFAPALEHGTSLALALRDTAGARKAFARMLRVDSTSGDVASDRWVLASALGDSAGRRVALRSDSLIGGLMIGGAVTFGLPLQDADSVLRLNQSRAIGADDRATVQRFLHLSSVISGRPSRAVALPSTIPESVRLPVLYLEARFADGDSLIGAAAGRTLERAIGTPVQPTFNAATARFAAGQSAFDRGRLEEAERAVTDLRQVRVPSDSAWEREVPTAFALLLDAELTAKRRSPELANLLTQLDSALIDVSFVPFAVVGNLIAARLFEQQGDLPRALAAIRRRVFDLTSSRFYALYVTYNREEGRLAALNGDREGAVRAYRRYLALRSGAEPRLQPQVARVRSELQALEQETTDR